MKAKLTFIIIILLTILPQHVISEEDQDQDDDYKEEGFPSGNLKPLDKKIEMNSQVWDRI